MKTTTRSVISAALLTLALVAATVPGRAGAETMQEMNARHEREQAATREHWERQQRAAERFEQREKAEWDRYDAYRREQREQEVIRQLDEINRNLRRGR
jgi:hypothetical protein